MSYFKRARVRLLLDHPFFGILAMHLKETEDANIETCATDGKNLFINPSFAKSLTDEEKQGLLAHEILHVALSHVWDWRISFRDKSLWNVAADYVVNQIVKNAGMRLPEGGLIDEKYKDMPVEKVYEILKKEATSQKKKAPWNDIMPAKHENKELETQWKNIMAQAALAAKTQGKLPGSMERLVNEIINPKLPWQRILDLFCNDILMDDYSGYLFDRRYLQQGLYFPDLQNDGCSVVVAVDTSGSIGQDELRDFVSEVVGIMKQKSVKKIRLFAFDAKVQLDTEISFLEDLPKLPGGGGSDCRPVFRALENESIKPSVMIVFTDLILEVPKSAPSFPVIWVSKEDGKAPFGYFVKYEKN